MSVGSAPEQPAGTDRDGAWDPAAALVRTEGDVELLSEMAQLFLSDSTRLIANVQAAISNAAPRDLEDAAHELKGCLGNFVAHRAFDAAATLEMLGQASQMDDAVEAARLLEAELDRFTRALQNVIVRRAGPLI